jgi:hypothetical protein
MFTGLLYGYLNILYESYISLTSLSYIYTRPYIASCAFNIFSDSASLASNLRLTMHVFGMF